MRGWVVCVAACALAGGAVAQPRPILRLPPQARPPVVTTSTPALPVTPPPAQGGPAAAPGAPWSGSLCVVGELLTRDGSRSFVLQNTTTGAVFTVAPGAGGTLHAYAQPSPAQLSTGAAATAQLEMLRSALSGPTRVYLTVAASGEVDVVNVYRVHATDNCQGQGG